MYDDKGKSLIICAIYSSVLVSGDLGFQTECGGTRIKLKWIYIKSNHTFLLVYHFE